MSRPSPDPSPLDAPEGCPEVDTLAQYAEGVLGDRRRAALDVHVAECDRCRSLLAGLARADLVTAGAVAGAPDATASRLRWWVVGIAAAATLVVGVVLAQRPRRSEPTGTEARLLAVAARLRVERPDLLADFRPLDARELAAGGAEDVQRGGIVRMAPSGATVETRPSFEWADVDGAASYVVSALDAEGTRAFSEVVTEARLDGARLPAPLARGADYVWKVTAVGAPTPAEGTSALRVGSEADARAHAAVVSAVAAATDDTLRDLATAHALLRLGFASDALPYARRHAKAHPSDEVGRATLAHVRRLLAADRGPR
jgi:hypothetical protein